MGLVDRSCDCREPCGVAGWGTLLCLQFARAVLGVSVAGGMSAFEDASKLIECDKRLKTREDLFGV
jgi:hypothetical protein